VLTIVCSPFQIIEFVTQFRTNLNPKVGVIFPDLFPLGLVLPYGNEARMTYLLHQEIYIPKK